MLSLFRKKPARPEVACIVVSRSAFAHDEPFKLVAEVVGFVNAMIDKGHYLRSEIPQSAMQSYHVDYYLAQVANGGHGQFVGNSGWLPETIADCRAGLAAMRAEPYDAIFADLCSLIESDAARAEAIAAGGGFGEIDPAIAALDKRFFAQDPYKVISPVNARWLKDLHELRVVEDDRLQAEIEALCAANPQREARMQARRRQRLEAQLRDPLRVAANLLCARGNFTLVAIAAGAYGVAPDGREGTAWSVATHKGNRSLFLFDDVCYLCEECLPDGRLVTHELLGELVRQADAGDTSGIRQLDHRRMVERARISTPKIHEAIAAADRLHIVATVDLLCRSLNPPPTPTRIAHLGKTDQGDWLWTIDTEANGFLVLYMTGETVTMMNERRERVVNVARRKVDEALKAQVTRH